MPTIGTNLIKQRQNEEPEYISGCTSLPQLHKKQSQQRVMFRMMTMMMMTVISDDNDDDDSADRGSGKIIEWTLTRKSRDQPLDHG